MLIYVVKTGDTLASIANQYSITPEQITRDNELPNPDKLVIGQSLLILQPEVTHTVQQGETLSQIAEKYKTTENQILQNNFWIGEKGFISPGELLVISYKKNVEVASGNFGNIVVNGYAYPFIDKTVLRKTLPYLTYLLIFTYGFTAEGELIPPQDSELIQYAIDYGVGPIMVLAPMNAQETFDTQIAHNMFNNPEGQNKLIDNILANIKEKGYRGIDIDFEFILPEDKQLFIDFIQKLKNKLSPEGYTVSIALAPKTSVDQPGLLYQAHDYAAIGPIVDDALLMTYEWGYTYGPPMATAPINNVRQVLEFGKTQIDPNKILMGLPNYAYDWPLPYVKGQTAAESISNIQAVARAAQYNVEIQFDPVAQAPFYNYTNEQGIAHVVWFDDARSMSAKLLLINELKIHGAGVWQIMDFFPQMWFNAIGLYNITKV